MRGRWAGLGEVLVPGHLPVPAVSQWRQPLREGGGLGKGLLLHSKQGGYILV